MLLWANVREDIAQPLIVLMSQFETETRRFVASLNFSTIDLDTVTFGGRKAYVSMVQSDAASMYVFRSETTV